MKGAFPDNSTSPDLDDREGGRSILASEAYCIAINRVGINLLLFFTEPTGGGEAQWDLRNRNQQFVASGVYFYHVETPDGKSKIGRFTVVNFAQ